MANEVLIKQGTQLSFADHAGDFAPAAAESFEVTPTDVQLTLSGVTNGAARQSDKIDLGATRAAQYSVKAAIEWFSAPTAGNTVDFYWFSSPVTTEANANTGNADGGDSAYTGDGGGTVAQSVPQLQYIGAMTVTDLAGVQHAHVGIFSPEDRFGGLVVVNNSAVTLAATDDIETHIVMTELIDEVQ